MAKLSDMLTFLRKRKGITQQELADKIDISRSAIGMYEAGKREPDLETLEAFADFYNVDMNTLTGRSTESTTPLLASATSKEDKMLQKLHNNFEKLNDSGQDRLVEYSDFLVSKEEYQKAAMVPASKEDTEQKPVETVRVWQAARSTDNSTPSGWIDMPKEEVEKIFNAPESDADF